MLVEIAGIPGSGKTTLHRHLKIEMKRRNLAFTDINAIARRNPAPNAVPRFVKAKPERAPLYRFMRFSTKHPDLISMAQELLSDAPIKQFLYFLLASNFQAALDLKKEGEIVIMDEGFLTHAVAASLSVENSPNLEKLISLSPPIDAIIFVNTPTDIAFERAINRREGVKDAREKVIAKFGDLSEFENRSTTLIRGIDLYRNRCRQIIEVDTSENLEQCAEHIVDKLTQENTPLS
jgi:thymidylate kinase